MTNNVKSFVAVPVAPAFMLICNLSIIPGKMCPYMDIHKYMKISKESIIYAWTGSTKRLQHVTAFPEMQDNFCFKLLRLKREPGATAKKYILFRPAIPDQNIISSVI